MPLGDPARSTLAACFSSGCRRPGLLIAGATLMPGGVGRTKKATKKQRPGPRVAGSACRNVRCHRRSMSTYETLLTPATYVASDDGMRSSPGASARHRGGWKSGLRRQQSSPQLLNSKAKASGVHPPKVLKKKPNTSNVIKRAIHKIGKKARKSSSSSQPSPSSSSAGVDSTPPKVRADRVTATSCLPLATST